VADAADVLDAVLVGEPEVAAQPVADVVAVEHVDEPTGGGQAFFHGARDGRLARPGQAGEPRDAAALAEQALPILSGDHAFVAHDVAGGIGHAASGGGFSAK